ncbi:uncharacterized protein LOC126672841 [Mercurialis annua]|uniref:uncharacterized protein LOC126672841 n=1 Tax=Mercurialis annua TaxID=3986 RepID=UPI00215F9DCB|nr:uncharacterized protein LOC126672841 [Mercurialis annua]
MKLWRLVSCPINGVKVEYLSKLVFDDAFYQTSIRLSSTANPNNITEPFLNVLRVLLFHHGSIFNFTLHVPSLKSYSEVDLIIDYLSEKDVHEISFDFRYKGKNYEFSRLPSFLFSCVKLRRLTLSSCSLTVPFIFQGCVNLISLKLLHLSTVICDEHLYGCTTFEATKFFQSMPFIEHLRLGNEFMDIMPPRIMPRNFSLGYLRVLELPRIYCWCIDDISAVLCLIVNSPNLKKLEIVFGSTHDIERVEYLAEEILQVQDLLSNVLRKLQVVKMKIGCTYAIKTKLYFIKFLLAESVELEKMFIQPPERTTAKERLRMLKKITRFPRASKKEEIMYLDPDDDDDDDDDIDEFSSDESEG